MPCLAPLTAYRPKQGSETNRLVFRKDQSETGVKVQVPCGQCVECRLDSSRQWAIRLMKERACHERVSFLTLTYDDAHLPEGGSLVKRDVALFHKRLHNRLLRDRDYGIRFYYSGEYGETYGRPHYHSIIFGFDFPDKQFYKRNSRDEPIFVSEFCRELWPFGRNGIGDVTFESCAYVAGYVTDKITVGHDDRSRAKFEAKYGRYDSEGRFFTVLPEFSGMSRRPGIGKPWFDRYAAETYRDDGVVVSGKFVRPPRYFDNLFDEIDSERLSMLKKERRRSARGLTSRQSFAREKIVKARIGLRRKDVTS